jgi:hypothetical protein
MPGESITILHPYQRVRPATVLAFRQADGTFQFAVYGRATKGIDSVTVELKHQGNTLAVKTVSTFQVPDGATIAQSGLSAALQDAHRFWYTQLQIPTIGNNVLHTLTATGNEGTTQGHSGFTIDPPLGLSVNVSYPAPGNSVCNDFTAYGTDSSGLSSVGYTLIQNQQTIRQGNVPLVNGSWAIVFTAVPNNNQTQLCVYDSAGGQGSSTFVVTSGSCKA